MLEFITQLSLRYQAIQQGLAEKNTRYQKNMTQLYLIEAFLAKQALDQQHHYAAQVVVMGPTQSGKSSLVNGLLNQNAAGVSPLAGFTVHPQGFLVDKQTQAINELLALYFSGLQQTPQYALNTDNYAHYALETINAHGLSECVVWDTPDFDSIGAEQYQQGVLKTLALADVLVLVVSKEKYADQSVWDILVLLAPLKQPMVVVLNKLILDSQAMVAESFEQRWQQVREDKCPTIFPVLFNKDSQLANNETLTATIKTLLKSVKRKKNPEYARVFINQHWDEWVLPLKIEQAAKQQWQLWVEQALLDALMLYQRDYLEHPQHYDTFQTALAKLLTLLEIPVLAKVMMQSRKALAWPLRKVLKLRGKAKSTVLATQETAVLQEIAEHVLLNLSDKLLVQLDSSQQHSDWWKQLNRQLRQDKGFILQHFEGSTQRYHQDFQPIIEQTAHSLYDKLAEQPALLNSLRAMRITTDAGLLALAVQAGGIGLHDLIIAPAMLSVTAYLAESAIGGYLQRSEAQLKQRQLKTVQQQLFINSLQQALIRLPDKLSDSTYFNLSAQQLAEAEAELKKKPHGLRIF